MDKQNLQQIPKLVHAKSFSLEDDELMEFLSMQFGVINHRNDKELRLTNNYGFIAEKFELSKN